MRYWLLAIAAVMLLAVVLGPSSAQGVDLRAIRRQAAAEGWTFRVAENPATQRPLSELTGMVEPANWRETATFDRTPLRRGFPARFDWREQVAGGLPPVRDQGGCGSCWAFATVGSLECNIKIKDGINVDISEQYLVSCNYDGWSCGGGWYAHAYHHDKQGKDQAGVGAVPEYDFPYVGTDVACGGPHIHTYQIADWAYFSSGVASTESLKQMILDHGPVAVSVAVDSNFQAYSNGIFNANTATSINHSVVLVGWDDNNGAGYWIMRNSWGPGWGEGGYMRIRYGCDMIGYAATWIDYPGKNPLALSFPNGTPKMFSPGIPTTIAVDINEVSDAYAPGTGKMYYRYQGGAFSSVPLVNTSDNHYTATLPAAQCGDEPEFYAQAAGIAGSISRAPEDAPARNCDAVTGTLTTVLYDNFESNLGWTVQNSASLIRGPWQRGIPIGGGVRGDPPTDYDGSGKCYVTGNATGDNDVDGTNAYTYLISPSMDLSGGTDALVHYALWYDNDFGAAPNADLFRVWVSNDGGTNWVLAEVVGPYSKNEGWEVHEFTLASVITLTNRMKVRFEASDLDSGSTVEAGVDDVRISSLQCTALASTAPAGWFTPGWTWFSIPLTPSGSNAPSTLLGFDCTNRLYRWDGMNKTVQYSPDDFNNLTVGTGYMVFLNLGESYRPSYPGILPASPLERAVNRAGCWWIGVPGIQSRTAADISVRKNGVTRTQGEDAAAADPWLNWNWVYWDPSAQTARIMDPSGSGDDRNVHPWYGYRIWVNTDGVSLVFP